MLRGRHCPIRALVAKYSAEAVDNLSNILYNPSVQDVIHEGGSVAKPPTISSADLRPAAVAALERVAQGDRVIVTRYNLPVAALVPYSDLTLEQTEGGVPMSTGVEKIEAEFLLRYDGDKRRAAKALAEWLAAGQQALIRLLRVADADTRDERGDHGEVRR